MTFNLFVYGTLRREGDAHDMLAQCEYIGAGTVGGTLYDIDGRFPALVFYGDTPVHGDVLRCPIALLPQLDEYEQTAEGLFRRIAADVQHNGGMIPCWLYTAGPALSQRLTPERRLAGGEWPPQPAFRP